jgi:hypothetical protein
VCNVILFFRTIVLLGIANFQNARLLIHFVQPPKADAEKSRLGYAVASSVLIGETMPACPGNPARGSLRSFPKRNLSPLRRACLSLGLPVDARPGTNMAWLLRKAGLGKTAIEYLKFSRDEQARRIVALYGSLNATERKAVTIDYLIMAAGADVHHISGVVQEELSRVRGIEAGFLACMDGPNVMRKTIEHAMTPKGQKDRELVLRIVGFLPTPPQRSFAFLRRGRGV